VDSRHIVRLPMAHTSPAIREYTVGWISALVTEYVVALEFLDEEYGEKPVHIPHDDNTYRFGRIGDHNVVMACLPKASYGTTSAASVAKDMTRSFPRSDSG
jgi:hypothetical protein